MKRILSILGLALLAMNVWAQQALFSGNDIVSPEVHPDGTVTFPALCAQGSEGGVDR